MKKDTVKPISYGQLRRDVTRVRDFCDGENVSWLLQASNVISTKQKFVNMNRQFVHQYGCMRMLEYKVRD